MPTTYLPDEQGGYNFDLPNGQTIYAAGPAAKFEADKRNAALLAANGGGGNMSTVDGFSDPNVGTGPANHLVPVANDFGGGSGGMSGTDLQGPATGPQGGPANYSITPDATFPGGMSLPGGGTGTGNVGTTGTDPSKIIKATGGGPPGVLPPLDPAEQAKADYLSVLKAAEHQELSKRASAGQFIKGGKKEQVSEQIVREGQLDSGQLDKLKDATKKAGEAGYNQQQAINDVKAGLKDREKDIVDQFQSQQEQEEAIGRQKLAQINEKINAKLEQIEKGEIDPDRLYQRAGTVGQIGIAIGALLSGIGNALMGKPGENTVLKSLDQAVERDIRLQQDERAQKGKQVSHLQDVYKTTLAETGDKAIALNKAKLLALEQAARDAEKIVNASDSPVAKANYEKMVADMNLRGEQLEAENAAKMKVAANYQVSKDRVVGGSSGPNLQKIIALRKAAVDVTNNPHASPGQYAVVGDSVVQFRPGTTPGEGEKIRAMFAKGNTLIDELNKLDQAQKKSGSWSYNQTESAALTQSIAAQLSQLRGQGAMTDQELNNAQKVLTGINTVESRATLKGIIDNAMKRTGQQLGMRPAPKGVKLALADQPAPQSLLMYDDKGVGHDVPLSKVKDAFQSGGLGFAPGTTIPIQTADGTIANNLKAEDFENFLNSEKSFGTNLATQGQYQEQETAKEYGTLGKEFLAAGAGAARGLTLGLSDLALAGIGGEGTRKELENLEKYSPNASLAGELGGALLPAFFTGGESLAATGARTFGRGVTAIPRAVGAVGELGTLATKEIISAATLGWGGEGMLARGVARGVGGAIEGAAFGAGNVLSQSVLKNDELTAEKLFAGLGHGAVLGGALAGSLQLLGGAGGKAFDAAKKLSRGGTSEAVAGESATARKALEYYAGGDKQVLEDLTKAWENRASLLQKGEQELETATRTIREQLDELVKTRRKVTAAFDQELKFDAIKSAVKQGDEALTFAAEDLAKYRAMANEMMDPSLPKAFGKQAQVRDFIKQIDYTEKAIMNSVSDDLNATIFREMDRLKRGTGKLASGGRASIEDADFTRRFRDIYEQQRVQLENPEIYGNAAQIQKEINRARSTAIDYEKRMLGDFFTELPGKDVVDPFLVQVGTDSAKLRGYLGQLGRASQDNKALVFEGWVQSTDELIEKIGKYTELTPQLQKEVEAARKATDKLKAVKGDTEKTVEQSNRIRDLQEQEQARALLGGSGTLQTFVDMAVSPLKTMERVAAAEKLAERLSARLKSAVNAFADTAPVKAVAKVRAVPTGEKGVRKWEQERAKDRQEFERKKKELEDFLASPVAKTPAGTGTLDQRVQSKAVLASQFLWDKLPKQATLGLNKTAPPTTEQLTTFQRYQRAVEDPVSVIADMKAGKLTPEAVEAIQRVYPALHAEMLANVLEKLGSGKELPYTKQIQVGILFGLKTNAMLEPAMIQLLQQSYQPNASPQSTPTPPPKPINATKLASHATKSDALGGIR